jgi:hypothetical protein
MNALTNRNQIIVSAYENVWDTNGQEIDLLEFLNGIKTGSIQRDLIEQIRSCKEKKKRMKLKESLSNIIPTGLFRDASDKGQLKPSGFISLDADNVEDVDSMKEDITKICPFVFSAFKTVSNNGLKILVKIPSDPTLHKDLFKALEDYFYENYGLKIDRSGKNLSRRVYASYDPDLYLNPDSEIFNNLKTEGKSETSTTHYEDGFKFFRELMDKIPVKVVDNGKYTEYRNLICAVRTKLGDEEARKFAERVLINSSMFTTIDEIIKNATVTEKPKEVLSFFEKMLNPKKQLDGLKDDYKSPYYLIKKWLGSRYLFKYNVVKNKVLYKSINDTEWKHVDDIVMNNLILEMDSDRIKSSKDSIGTTIYSEFSLAFDPIKDYFSKVKSKLSDKSDSEIVKFYNLISEKPKTESDNLYEAVKTWFASAAGLAIGDNGNVHTLYCLAFFGKQGSGKTSIFKSLVPPELSEYAKENMNDYDNKDAKIDVAKNFLMLLDEFGESGKQDYKKIKSLITQSSINERLPYARTSIEMPRRCSFVATFDKPKIYDDAAGNRRFVTLHIKKINWEEYKTLDIDKLWAQALHIYETGAFSKTIDAFLLEANEKYEKVSMEMELLQSYLDTKPNGDDEGQKLSSTEIMGILQDRSHIRTLKVQAVGDALKKLGYVSKSTRTKTGGYPKNCYTVCFKALPNEFEESRFER